MSLNLSQNERAKMVSRWFDLIVDGYPADCVQVGSFGLLDELPDFVVSGINIGINTGLGFFMASGTTKILVLVYAVLFAAQTGNAAGAREMGQTSLLANGVIAGVAMILCHEFLVVVPSPFVMPLIAFAAAICP